MSVVAAAIIGSAVVGGVTASRAADKQSDAIRSGTDQQVAESRRQYDQAREDFSPWREAGINAMNMLADPIKNFYASPDYQFRMKEGIDQTGATFAMKGGGGNAMRGMETFRQNLASSEFGNWFNRLFMQSEAGRGANSSMVAANQNTSNNIAGAYGNQGYALANVAGNKYANINNAFQSGVSNYLYAGGRGYLPWQDGKPWGTT